MGLQDYGERGPDTDAMLGDFDEILFRKYGLRRRVAAGAPPFLATPSYSSVLRSLLFIRAFITQQDDAIAEAAAFSEAEINPSE